jgi:hypothetical protein
LNCGGRGGGCPGYMPVDQRLLRVDSNVYGEARGFGEARDRLALRMSDGGRGDADRSSEFPVVSRPGGQSVS